MNKVAEQAQKAYGSLPKGWSRRRLRFDVELNPKKSSLDMDSDALVSFIPMEAVGEHGSLDLKERRELGEVYNGYTYFADGDLCIAKITPCFENGKGALAEGLMNGVAFGTTELHVIRAGVGIDRRFLYYVSVADDFRKLGESEMYGAGGQKRINESFIRDWMPPLPPLETQKRIAQFLNEKTAKIDGLIEKKRDLLDRLAEKRQALITQAVTKGLNPNAPMKPSGVAWLGEIPEHWEVKKLKRLKQYLTSGSRDWGAYYADEGDIFLRMTNVTKYGIELDTSELRYVDIGDTNEGTRTATKKGDILITITAELGSVAIVREPCEGAYINQHMALFRPLKKAVDSEFLVNFLSTEMCRNQFTVSGQGGTKQGLGFEQVNNVIVGLPPKEEQQEIAKSCNLIWREFSHTEASVSRAIDLLQEYRAALIASAVTGQLGELR